MYLSAKRWLATRSDDARWWIKAKNSRAIWNAAKTQGKSLDDVLASFPKKVDEWWAFGADKSPNS